MKGTISSATTMASATAMKITSGRQSSNSSFIGDLTSDVPAPYGKPAPALRGQGAAGACEIALVTDRIRSKDGLMEGLAQCTMGGKPPDGKSSPGARIACLRRHVGILSFALTSLIARLRFIWTSSRRERRAL